MRLVDVKAQGCLVYMSGQNKEIKTYKNTEVGILEGAGGIIIFD